MAVVGALAGGGLLGVVMLLVAGVAIALGMVVRDDAGRFNLAPWLALELAGGAVTSVLAGALSRRIACGFRGPVVLAVGVLTVGSLEAAEILRQAAAGRVLAPSWLVLLAPLVGVAGVLLGGRSPRTLPPRHTPGAHRILLAEVLRYSQTAFVFGAATALTVLVLPTLALESEPLVLASALTLDLTVAGPAIAFRLLVRSKRAPRIAIVPIVAVGFAIATATIPSHQQDLLEAMRLLLVPLELGVVVHLVMVSRRVLAHSAGDGDFATRFRSAARQVLGRGLVADMVTTEVSILSYAFGGWRVGPQNAGSYTVHRRSGCLVMIVGLLMALGVETVAVHLLLTLWSPIAAWVLTGLSIYACIWLVGDYRALAGRPLRITGTHLALRLGVRWEVDIPRAAIAQAHLIRCNMVATGGTLVASLLRKPNVCLKLHGPIEVTGMYGMRRTVREIWMTVDDAAAFCSELRSAATS